MPSGGSGAARAAGVDTTAKAIVPTVAMMRCIGFLAKNAPSGPTRSGRFGFRRSIASAISTRAAALGWHLLPQSLRMALYQQWADGDAWDRGLTERTGRPAVAASDQAWRVVFLVFEDELPVLMSTTDILQDSGLHVVEAPYCVEAI